MEYKGHIHSMGCRAYIYICIYKQLNCLGLLLTSTLTELYTFACVLFNLTSPYRCKVTCGLVEEVQEEPVGAASWAQTVCLLPAWLLTLIPMHTPMLMGLWECPHPQLTLHIILILIIQESMACIPSTAFREVWGLIHLSPALRLTTSPQGWWHCA